MIGPFHTLLRVNKLMWGHRSVSSWSFATSDYSSSTSNAISGLQCCSETFFLPILALLYAWWAGAWETGWVPFSGGSCELCLLPDSILLNVFPKDDLYDYCYRVRRTIREILAEFRQVRIPKEYVFDIFPPMRPRQFSIASSVKVSVFDSLSDSYSILYLDEPLSDSLMYRYRKIQNKVKSPSAGRLHYISSSTGTWYVKLE